MTYGIIKHRTWLHNGYLPETMPLLDAPRGSTKGDKILISPEWWRYIEAINDEAGYRYARSVHMMWVNTDYDHDNAYSPARAEAITNSHNFVQWDFEQGNYGHLFAFNYDENPFDNFDPAQVNWYTRPDLFFKAISTTTLGAHANVARNVDCYLPILRYRMDRWIYLPHVERFPTLPWMGKVGQYSLKIRQSPGLTGVQVGSVLARSSILIDSYRPLGASVWGHMSKGWVCLLLSAAPGQRQFFTDWRLSTSGVIPPAV